MNYWRVTKYDPKNRDDNGFYKKDEWIGIGDIGKKFGDVELTFESYLSRENAYVAAVIRVMRENNVESLKVKPLQKSSQRIYYLCNVGFSEPETNKFYKSLKTNTMVSMHDVARIVRFAIRGIIWCKLVSDKMFVHFGYDYYMFVGSENQSESMLNDIISSGLFIESYISPYM